MRVVLLQGNLDIVAFRRAALSAARGCLKIRIWQHFGEGPPRRGSDLLYGGTKQAA